MEVNPFPMSITRFEELVEIERVRCVQRYASAFSRDEVQYSSRTVHSDQARAQFALPVSVQGTCTAVTIDKDKSHHRKCETLVSLLTFACMFDVNCCRDQLQDKIPVCGVLRSQNGPLSNLEALQISSKTVCTLICEVQRSNTLRGGALAARLPCT
jgi:hypothetical protein